MDPDETLRQIRALCNEIAMAAAAERAELAEQLAERVEALDEWMTKGGFAPAAWRDNR